MIKTSSLENILVKFIYILPLLIISGNFLADMAVVIINIIFLVILKKNNSFDFIYKNKYFWILVFFYFYLVLRSVFTLELISIKSSIFTFRHALFVFAFYYLYINKILNLNLLNLILIFVSLFLLIDASYQYKFDNNIFGYKILHPNRASSFFGDELIMGSYTFRILALIIPLTFFLNANFSKNKTLIKLSLIFFILFVLLILSGERLAFFLFLIYFFCIISLFVKKYLNKLFIFFLAISVVIFILKMNDNFSKRLIYATMDNLTSFVFKNNVEKENILSLSEMHDHHYTTGMNMFKDNILFGQGPKMFRIKCNDIKFRYGEHACSTHPHNIIIQFLAELGVIGISFLVYFYYSLFSNVKLFKKNPLVISTSILVFLIFFPFLPYGNFFHNGLLIMNLFSISILWCLCFYDRQS